MTPTLKAEFKKLLTVRSTYILTILLLLFLGFIWFWVGGYKNHDMGPHFLGDGLQTIAPLTSIIGAIVAVLLMAHEYRYNTVVYTLTASNSRSKVLAAKIITVFIYVFLLTLVVAAASLLLAVFGNNLAGHPLPHQDIDLVSFMTKALFYCEGFALIGLMVTSLIRNLVFSIVFLLLVPNTIEALATLVLKQKAVYLPFSSLSQVISPLNAPTQNGPFETGHLSPIKGAAVFGVYLAVGWIVTWYFFLRRDAS